MMAQTPERPRAALRRRLLAARRIWCDTPAAQAAQAALLSRVEAVLSELEPDCLGLYWPMPGEFNPCALALTMPVQTGMQLALPWASKSPVNMVYRQWDGRTPESVDDCGLPSSTGRETVPDVVLVPCVGFAPEGWRLGYGGGYFDRYLAAHPHVTAIGVAWDEALVETAELAPEAHDLPLMAVLTPSRAWGG